MQTYIALLRGINVSGQKKVPMAELREVLTKTGFSEVQTYIQSGNVVFKSSERDTNSLEERIKTAIKTHFGFDVPTLVKTHLDIEVILESCPFSEDKKEKSYFTLLHSKPEVGIVNEVSKLIYPNEEFTITNQCVYFYCATGYGRAKMNNNFFERKLKVSATTRNYKTMLKLLSLST